MRTRIVLLGVLVLAAAGAFVASDLTAQRQGGSATLESGECPRGRSCDWCVFDVTRTVGDDCPQLRKICVLCDEEEQSCPAIERVELEEADCTLAVELESEKCEDCPRGIPTFVAP